VSTPPDQPRPIPAWTVVACALVAYLAALALRLHQADAVMALADGTGPWLEALAHPLAPRSHAEPYGWALYTPYALCLLLAGSLRQAVGCLAALHALAAPLAVLVVLRLRPRAWLPALAAGLLIALDGSLLDTLRSGAECYLGPVWLGAAALGVAARQRPWGAPLALVGLVMAAMNHPFALCALPLLALLPWKERHTWIGAGIALLAALPSLLRLAGGALPGSGGAAGPPLDAWPVWLAQGGLGAWALAAAPLAGLARRESRGLALATLASAGLLFLLGWQLGYLRDHHLRLLSVPMGAGLAALPAWGALLPLLLLRLPPSQLPAPDHPHRPGTLGLASQLAGQIDAIVPPGESLVVDGAWISGTAAGEPAALMLDLHLRGRPAERFGPGGQVALVVSGDRQDLERIPGDKPSWDPNDRHFLVIGAAAEVREFTARLCGFSLRAGGAWDGLAVLRPELGAEDMRGWWAECGAR